MNASEFHQIRREVMAVVDRHTAAPESPAARRDMTALVKRYGRQQVLQAIDLIEALDGVSRVLARHA